MNQLKETLIYRLANKGMDPNMIPSYIRSMKICFVNKPNMNPLQANEQLQFLGWNDIELDYHTMQLAKACFETEGIL
jgi:hypothetical protein